jgi:2-iminoacetate synthase ThiH
MKNLGTLQEIARALSDAGVKELVIRNGEVTDFRVDKSIDEVVREAQAEELARHAQRMKEIEEEIKREKEAKAS